MALHPDLEALMEFIKRAGRPPLDSLPPDEARAAYAAGRTVMQPEPAEVQSVRNFSIPGPAGDVPVRFYRGIGTDPNEKLPCLVFYHGGGWVIGDLDSHDVLCRRLANDARCAVLATHYRLAPEHKFPAAYDDSIAALHYAARNADALSIDAGALAVGGDSAGGNLAAAAALTARDEGLALRHQVLIYPVTDMAMTMASYQRVTEGFPLVAKTMVWFIDHYLRDAADKNDWRASPLRAASLAGTAPATVIVAAHDPLADEGLAYAKRLEQEGVVTNTLHFSGQAHGFVSWGKFIRETETAVQMAAIALRNAWR